MVFQKGKVVLCVLKGWLRNFQLLFSDPSHPSAARLQEWKRLLILLSSCLILKTSLWSWVNSFWMNILFTEIFWWTKNDFFKFCFTKKTEKKKSWVKLDDY